MARKSTNLLGIHREMLQAGQDNKGESFVKGAMGAFAINLAEQEKKRL